MNYYFVTIESFNDTTQNLVGVTDDNIQLGIPADEGNSDYREYLAWVAEGNTAEQWQPEQPIVEEPMVEDAN